MSDRLISALTVLTTPAGDDYLPIIDISEGVGTSKNKRITIDDLFRSIPNANVQPNWTGKLNGWPDPFFRKLTSANATALYNRNRWYNPFAGWTLVNNTIFDGKALRRDVTATTGPLNGPAIWFDDIGATVGSQVTVCALVTGNGATVSIYGRTYSSTTTPGIGFVSAQQSLRTKEGVGTITTTSSPQFVSLTVTVTPTETGIILYSQHPQNTLYYDIIALWAFKGTLVSGLDWPNLGDEIRAEATSNTAITSTNTANIATNTANLAYATISVTDVTYASGATTLNGTGFTTVPRDSPFTGWGEVYTPSGVSFNAIQVASLTRTAALETSKWRTLYAVVKTAGSASAAPSGTVVAVGSVTVNPGNDTLTDETILLRNPSTNALITLTNANFSSHYFIGIYARNATGGGASCGEPLGTMPNSAGQSYYVTGGDPLGAGWATYTQNLRLGFRHLLLTSPAETTGYEPTSEFVNDIQALFPVDSADYVPTLVVPPTIYAVQGREVNIYFDNLVLEDISRYNVDVTTSGSLGDHQNERWTWVPSGELPSGLVSITLHDKGTSTQLASASTIRRAAGSGWGSGLTKKVMMVGDSLTNDATITQTLLDIDATDVMSITLYGTRGTAPNRHEGRGGWTVTNYTSPSGLLTISGVPVSVPNPFWRASGTPAVDFGWYLTQNAYPAMDWVLIQLGTNDVFSATSDGAAVSAAQAAFVRMDTLITSIKASDANTKVGLVIAPPPSFDQDSFGANYGAGQTRWRFKRNILIWARDLIARYQGRESPDRIFIVPSNTALDTLNNMSRASSAPVNSRSAVTSTRQNNGLHPVTSGYQQIADAIWAFLKYQA